MDADAAATATASGDNVLAADYCWRKKVDREQSWRVEDWGPCAGPGGR